MATLKADGIIEFVFGNRRQGFFFFYNLFNPGGGQLDHFFAVQRSKGVGDAREENIQSDQDETYTHKNRFEY